MKKFNVTGNCIPSKHYMVDTADKITKIVGLVDYGEYFTINRARQYGKTTTLDLLEIELNNLGYTVAYLSFEGLSDIHFESSESFCKMFMEQMQDYLHDDSWFNSDVTDFKALGNHIEKLCNNRKIVVLIDEVDKTSNNITFLYFLGMLRNSYLKRMKQATFHSVILAGVTDIKNIKYQLVNKGFIVLGENEGSHNSPWNIAVDFEVDMSFNPIEIATMLTDYEKDYGTGMNICAISEEIYNYTSGYPFLVSRICQHIDTKLDKDWTISGVQKAVKIILKEKNMLFDDLVKNMENNKNLYNLLKEMLFSNFTEPGSYLTSEIQLGLMYGILDSKNGLNISNVIYKTVIANYIEQKEHSKFRDKTQPYQYSQFIKENKLDMELVMGKFSEFMYEEYRESDMRFIEQNGRLLFLSFLKPIINGYGLTFVETETRQNKRMDVVVVYEGEQFIIELKIWYGDVRHDKAYEQIITYLNSKNLERGYLLTFDFRKGIKKVRKLEWIEIGEKKIFDVIV